MVWTVSLLTRHEAAIFDVLWRNTSTSMHPFFLTASRFLLNTCLRIALLAYPLYPLRAQQTIPVKADQAAQQPEFQRLPNGTPPIVTSDSVKLYVDVAGEGPPCVFIHGGPGSGSQVIETLTGNQLQRQFQMIYLDQRGSGRSASDPHKDYTLARVVKDLDELRQQLHLDKWVLMAHSFGGIIATAYASQHPQRVEGLILLNSILNLPASMESTVAYGYSLLPPQGRPVLDPATSLPQRYGMVMSLLNQQKRITQLMYTHDATALRVQQAQQGNVNNHEFTAVVTQTAAIMDYLQDFTRNSATLLMPVLVVTGRDDYVVGPNQYKSFRFPNQQVVQLPGRHFSLFENSDELQPVFATFSAQLRAKR